MINISTMSCQWWNTNVCLFVASWTWYNFLWWRLWLVSGQRLTPLPLPWFSSFFHKLIYCLMALEYNNPRHVEFMFYVDIYNYFIFFISPTFMYINLLYILNFSVQGQLDPICLYKDIDLYGVCFYTPTTQRQLWTQCYFIEKKV